MKFSRSLRAKIGQYRFVKELKKVRRIPEVINFNEAEKIGVLYDATDFRDFETVKSYVKSVRSTQKKDIQTLGFVNKSKLSEKQFAHLGFDFFTNKDLNFKMIPVNKGVKNFIDEKFDILICLDNLSFPLKYVSAMSNARFKIGRYSETVTGYLDLMVSLTGEPSLKTVLDETENILRLIKK